MNVETMTDVECAHLNFSEIVKRSDTLYKINKPVEAENVTSPGLKAQVERSKAGTGRVYCPKYTLQTGKCSVDGKICMYNR